MWLRCRFSATIRWASGSIQVVTKVARLRLGMPSRISSSSMSRMASTARIGCWGSWWSGAGSSRKRLPYSRPSWSSAWARVEVIGIPRHVGGPQARASTPRRDGCEHHCWLGSAWSGSRLVSFLSLLPMAFVMVAGPQILSAIFLATTENWKRNSALFVLGAGLSITTVVTAAYLLGNGASGQGASDEALYIVAL